MFALAYTRVSSISISWRQILHTFMPSGTLSGLGERILLAVWKLNGVGNRSVTEHILKAELSGVSDDISQELQRLQEQGFIVRTEAGETAEFALTPIGLAILRQVEEDKLQELG